MRIFLDNKGTSFKTVNIPFPCNMYSLCDIMRKKVFTDTVGFGIYEVSEGTGKNNIYLILIKKLLIIFY